MKSPSKIWPDSAPSQTLHLTPLDDIDDHNVSRALMSFITELNIPISYYNLICSSLFFGFNDHLVISNTTLEFPQSQICETLRIYIDLNSIIYSSELDLIDLSQSSPLASGFR